MPAYRNTGEAPFSAALWVPPPRLALWRREDPDGSEEVLADVEGRFCVFVPPEQTTDEDELSAFRLVLAGGDEVGLLKLTASGLIADVQTLQTALVWVKRRRASSAIIGLPNVARARERLVAALGPYGWETPDIPKARYVMAAIRELEGILMTWMAIRRSATSEQIEEFALAAIHRTEKRVGRATSTT